jgi:hypothetical protein
MSPGWRNLLPDGSSRFPNTGPAMLNDVFLREGRYIEAGRRGEALVSEAFASANHLTVGDSINAVLNGKWERLRVVGIALSPEYISKFGPRRCFQTISASVSCG